MDFVNPVNLKHLDSLEKAGMVVVYSEGARDRAEEQLQRLSNINAFYKNLYNIDIQSKVFLLNQVDLEKGIGDILPYGMPVVFEPEKDGDPNAIYLPATDEGVIIDSTLIFKDIVTDQTRKLFTEAGVSVEEGIKIFPQLIGLHEVGHTVAFELNYTDSISWFNELMATYFAYCYLREKQPDLAKVWEGNSYITYLDGGQPEYKSLADFERLYSDVGPANYDWYQKQFALVAEDVFNQYGLEFGERVTEIMKECPEITSEELFIKLNKLTESLNRFKA